MIMPGSESEGKRGTKPEANKASKQDADGKFKDRIGDMDPKTQKKYGDKATGNERSDLNTGNLKGSD
jgi:hypothetical protein